MIKIKRHHFIRLLLLATALPFGLLAADAMSALAATVTVTGANGTNGAPGQPGGAGGSATATATSSDPSNTATATGGNGGIGGAGGDYYRSGAGGHGGVASSSATASNMSGPASATATSTGGNGGRGGLPNPCRNTCIPGAGGGGGVASAISSATGGGAGAVTSDATASGGAAPIAYNNPAAGTASASASARSTASGLVEANASAFDPSKFTGEYSGETGDRASVTASAQNQSGRIVTTAAAPRGSTASALSSAVVFSPKMAPAPESLVAISAGHAVSNAALTPTGPVIGATGRAIGVGAVSAAYGGEDGLAVTYEATATFDFFTPTSEALDLYLSSFSFVGLGFDRLLLWVQVNNDVPHTYAFSSLTGSGGAETYFTTNKNEPLPLDTIAANSQSSVELVYDLTYNIGTSAAIGDGFGLTYGVADPPVAGIPEPSTWAMMLVGFAGLAWVGHRASRTSVAKST